MIYYYKILNVRKSNGQYDYKELNIDLLGKGYSKYPFDDDTYNYCIVASIEDFPSTNERIKLTEEEYLKEKVAIEKLNGDYKTGNSESTIDDRVEKLENDITVLQNGLVEQHYNELMKGVK
ncbi:hypothetical protein [Clostridium botulinum]|uniref:hypothetical protein n=1 Tax=Clostridium botulinum TaxID=1491 RepID=UPI003DA2829C